MPTMSLKPRNVDFQEIWSNLKETVSGVVALRAVGRGEWNTRFSDVYALCVAHPEPLADRLYDETRNFLEEHVAGLLKRVRGEAPLENNDHNDGLLLRYVAAWREYSQGIAYLNCLYSYLNLQHVKRQKVSDAEIIYGSAATASCADHESRQLEVGELGLVIWERVLVRPLAGALTGRLVGALEEARERALPAPLAEAVRAAVGSTVAAAGAARARAPLALYQRLVLEPFLAAAGARHAALAADLLRDGDISRYMRGVLDGLARETALAARFLHPASGDAVRACFERAAVAAHLPALHAHTERLLREAADDGAPPAERAARRADLRRMHALLRPLAAPGALRPLVDAAHAQAAREGRARLAAALAAAGAGAVEPAHDAPARFVGAVLALHDKYSRLFDEVFDGAQAFAGALDRACSEVVNARAEPPERGERAERAERGEGGPARAPELLARYCDALLRRRGAAGGADAEADERLAAAIVVFKYVDDKDVFQKHYARALARRLIHQLSASMEQEEAMINRLKAACGYEFTNKLHRMFTDIAVSADLNAKFQQYLRDNNLTLNTGFFIQVLQAGAWPLGGAMAPLAPPAQLERPARLFEAFYRASFSGRRLAWLHHLCTGELRTRYTARVHVLCASTAQCALLLLFERADELPAADARDALQLAAPAPAPASTPAPAAAAAAASSPSNDAWARLVRPALDAGLLLADGDVLSEDGGGRLRLNLAFTAKRARVRLACAAPAAGAGGAGAAGGGGPSGAGEADATHCDDDRKMYLQAALVRIMKQRKVLRHNELIQEVVSQARGSFAPSVAMIKKCIEALIDKQYLERAPGRLDTYSYLA